MPYETEVTAGAEYLDQTYPGWEGHIDLAALDMRESCRCILGQLIPLVAGLPTQAGNRSLYILDSEGHPRAGYSHWLLTSSILSTPVALGFTLSHHDKGSWSELEETWISLIKNRFDTGALSDVTN